MALPTPASWHGIKGKATVIGDQYDRTIITNHAAADFTAQAVQYTQCREELVTPSAKKAQVNKDITGKTAINRANSVAAEGRLFNYGYIEAGQTFIGWIDCKIDTINHQIKALMGREYRIGRSRNAEFGRVKLTLLDKMPKLSTPANRSNRLV